MAIRTTYNLSNFDRDLAASGRLCVMVSEDYTEDTISNIEINTSTDQQGNTVTETTNVEAFKGAGICRVNSPVAFEFVVNSISYLFKTNGLAESNNAQGCKLMMGEKQGAVSSIGSAVKSSAKAIITRSADGTVTTSTSYAPTMEIIDSLNARDQFAIQALKGMLEHIPDPSRLSESEIDYYCNAAYQWAANMMTLSANTRSTVEDASSSSDAKPEEVGALESNTEKLLNNIIAALEKTDAAVYENGKKVNAERITIPEITSILKAYISNGESTVGFKDLINSVDSLTASVNQLTEKVVAALNNISSSSTGN